MSWSHGHVSSLLHTSYFSLSPAQALSPSSPLPFDNGALSHRPGFVPSVGQNILPHDGWLKMHGNSVAHGKALVFTKTQKQANSYVQKDTPFP